MLCGLFSKLYNDYSRKYKLVMHLVNVYGHLLSSKERMLMN